MGHITVFSYFRFLLITLEGFCLLITLGNPALAQIRLDDSNWMARARIGGIDEIRKTSDTIEIQIGSPSSFKSSLVFPVEPGFDPQRNNLLEITMRTGPRIHNFWLIWKQIGQAQSFIQPPIYRDGEFHAYLIPLDTQPSWGERISYIGFVWLGTREFVEIKTLELRSMRIMDHVRYQWSHFWAPEMLNGATVNVIGGPILLGQSLAFLLGILFVALLPVLSFTRPRDGSKNSDSQATESLRQPRRWLQSALCAFMTLWVAYDLREAYNHVQILKPEFRYYINSAYRHRQHPELDDFYDFINFVDGVIPPSKGVGFYSAHPLFIHARYYLFPRPVSDRTPLLDYTVIYQDPGVTFQDGKLMDKGKLVGSGLKLVGKFGEDALLLESSNE